MRPLKKIRRSSFCLEKIIQDAKVILTMLRDSISQKKTCWLFMQKAFVWKKKRKKKTLFKKNIFLIFFDFLYVIIELLTYQNLPTKEPYHMYHH